MFLKVSSYLNKFKDAWTKKGFSIEPQDDFPEKATEPQIVAEIIHYAEKNESVPLKFVSKQKPIRFYLGETLYEATVTKPQLQTFVIGYPRLPVGPYIACREI
ncbi:hypothetical protein M2452_000375 [Enterococcus sp. PFB1-1]|nr:hypothetical protein [Enterococcus sp. PFB1-1]